MIQKILTSSRFIVLIAVVGALVASLACLVFGAIKVVTVLIGMFQKGIAEQATKAVAVDFIEVVDLFLIGIIFYIIAMGFYELFIDDRLQLPAWLVIHSLDDLKMILISGMVVVMGVYFLGALVDWKGQTDLLPLSVSIALIIAVLTFFQYVNAQRNA